MLPGNGLGSWPCERCALLPTMAVAQGEAQQQAPVADPPAAGDDEYDTMRLQHAIDASAAAAAGGGGAVDGGGTTTTDVVEVPPTWHRFVGNEDNYMLTIKTVSGLTNIESRMPPRTDLDGRIVLEGSPSAVAKAKQLLKEPIEEAHKQQQLEDSPKLLKLLELGYERANAKRALLETHRRGAPHNMLVQAALDWLIELEFNSDDDAEEEEQEALPQTI